MLPIVVCGWAFQIMTPQQLKINYVIFQDISKIKYVIFKRFIELSI
jgi:hypothetical protein